MIFLSGGYPFYLMHQLRRCGGDSVLWDLHTAGLAFIVAHSAGAVVLGPDLIIVTAFE